MIAPNEQPGIATPRAANCHLRLRLDPDSIVRAICRAQTIARSQTRSRDVSDPRDRPWGQGRGSGGGVAHVPAALRGVLSVGKDRRRIVSGFARVSVRKLPQRIQLRGRDPLMKKARYAHGLYRYTSKKGGDGRPGAISLSTSPSVLCQVLREAPRINVGHRGATWAIGSAPAGKIRL